MPQPTLDQLKLRLAAEQYAMLQTQHAELLRRLRSELPLADVWQAATARRVQLEQYELIGHELVAVEQVLHGLTRGEAA